MSSIKEQIKSQIALLKAEEKRLKDIEKLKARNQAFQMRMTKEYEKNPVSMLIWVWKLSNNTQIIHDGKRDVSQYGMSQFYHIKNEETQPSRYIQFAFVETISRNRILYG